jgi:hypothetical protein
MYRLHPRGAANRGVCVDADGAILGPDWSLVKRTSAGYRVAPRDAARDIQKVLLIDRESPDWLYAQGQRIADALSRGEVALAQIYGLRIPIGYIDQRQLERLAAIATLAKAGFNPDEPRIPAGQPGGGEWTTDESSSSDSGPNTAPASALYAGEAPSPSPTPLTGGRWPAPAGENTNPLFFPVQAEEDEDARSGGLLGNYIDPLAEFRQERYDRLRAQLRDLDPGNPALQSLTGPDYSPTQADIDALSEALQAAQEQAGEPPATEWQLGWGARGIALEQQRLGGQRSLPFNAPTIDDFSDNGVAVSVKSIDLNAPWYANSQNLSRQIDNYVDKLSAFNSMNWGNIRIDADQISGRVLDIVVPMNSGTAVQQDAITKAIERASSLGVYVIVSYY